MAYTHPTTKFNTYTPTTLYGYGTTITAAMLVNIVTFATPNPTLATVNTDLSTLNAAITAWGPIHARGSHADLLAMRAARKVVEADLRVLAAYVDSITQGSAATVALSGFTGTNPHTLIGMLNAPKNFRQLLTASTPNAGAVLKWAKPGNLGFGKVGGYLIEGSNDGGVSWKTIGIVSRTRLITPNPLPNPPVAGVPYQARATAINSAGMGTTTAPITVIFF